MTLEQEIERLIGLAAPLRELDDNDPRKDPLGGIVDEINGLRARQATLTKMVMSDMGGLEPVSFAEQAGGYSFSISAGQAALNAREEGSDAQEEVEEEDQGGHAGSGEFPDGDGVEAVREAADMGTTQVKRRGRPRKAK